MYWITLLTGLGLFISPFVFDVALHLVDARTSIILGIVIGSASIMGFGDLRTPRWVPIVIGLAGSLAIISGVLLAVFGHPRLFWSSVLLGAMTLAIGLRQYKHMKILA